jgi:prepilin signal peptidase PulO-like enzyme (type II secretory pathway)
MNNLFISLMLAVVGALIAIPIQYSFSRMPEAWLQDYDYDPDSKDFRPAKRMKFLPHTLCVLFFLAIVFFLTSYSNPAYTNDMKIFHLALALLPAIPLTMVILSDMLNRIIPDHLTIAAGILCVFGFLADLLEGSLWIPQGSPWYLFVLNRVLGGVIGAALLWGIGFLGSMFTGRESLGFGDVKLIGACGLLSGAYGLAFVIFISFVVGGIIAVPLLVRKRIRIRNEELLIIKSDDPETTRQKIEDERNAMPYADDPDYIAFGPFLALGTIVFLMFETQCHQFFAQMFLVSGM